MTAPNGAASVTAELYAALARPLRRHVRASVRAPDDLIEDACQFAWIQLVRHPGSVSAESVYGWLLSTAQREAYRLLRLSTRELSLEAELEKRRSHALERALSTRSAAAPPHELVQRHEHLRALRALPVRQQRMLWLQALGLSKLEVSVHERCTERTVDRQLCCARRQLREQLADAA